MPRFGKLLSKEFFRLKMFDPSRLHRWVTAGATSFVLIGPASNAAAVSLAQGDPASFVATVGQQIASVLTARELEADRRSRHLHDILVHALDLDIMARLVLGRHWRIASDGQRDRYIALFRNYLVDLIAVPLGGYPVETFTVLRQQRLRENDSLVIARLKPWFGRPFSVSFRVRRTSERMRIIDVTIAGVSLIVTKRSEFDAIIRHEGLPGLLRRLDEKHATMLLHRREVASFIAEAMSVMQSGVNGLFAH